MEKVVVNIDANEFKGITPKIDMKVVYLDEEDRVPGVDHYEEYLNSCFYTLIKKSIKERGTAYERLAAKVLRSSGMDAKVATGFCGGYDLIVDGKKFELKASRKASPYDTQTRRYQFCQIRDVEEVDGIMLMVLQPDDVVKIYQSTFTDLLPFMKPTDKMKSSYNLAKHPKDAGAELIAVVQVK